MNTTPAGFTATLRSIAAIAIAVLFACTAAIAQDKKAADSKDDAQFEARVGEMQKKVMKAMMTEFENQVQALKKDFPNRPEVYEMIMEIASNSEPDKALSLAKQVADSTAATEDVKKAAQALVNKYGAVGKPLDIKFTAVDGREVDLSKMKGKVVLVDFWATWCGPCVKELPHIKEVYKKLHGKGFEIVGISFDKEKSKLEQFVADEKMPWPQYFDGKGWANKYGQECGINSIPAMWLVDKKGVLRDLNARDDLEGKVEKLLAEK